MGTHLSGYSYRDRVGLEAWRLRFMSQSHLLLVAVREQRALNFAKPQVPKINIHLFRTYKHRSIHKPNIGAPWYTKQILTDTKGEIDSNRVIERDYNSPLTSMDRSSRQKIYKETLVLNDTLDQTDLIFIQHSTWKQQNTHSFQMHVNQSPG